MKKIYTSFFAIIIVSLVSNAQDGKSTTRNFYQIRKQFLQQYEQLERQNQTGKEDLDGDGLMQQFRRWEYLMQRRIYADGTLPSGNIQWQEWQKYQSSHTDQFAGLQSQPSWKQVGTNVVPSKGGGAGRVNVIRFDPKDTQTVYVGTANGGVWKTNDGGSSWNCLSDRYPVTSIADIAIDAINPNNIYVATGDGYGYEVSDGDFWGGVYTAGILRSTDGGVTWAQVAREIPQSFNNIIQRILLHPSNNKILLAATREGIYRSDNAGQKWRLVSSAHCYDMEWNAANPEIVYAGGNGTLYRSKDAGLTWNALKTGIGIGRMSIEVCAAEPRVIYALGQNSGFYKTTDGGTNWTAQSYPYGAGFYGYYDLVLTCSQASSNYLIAGGLNTVKSTDGGMSWKNIDNWSDYNALNYVHADKHAGIFFPGSNDKILVGTDGGIFKTTNRGTNWSDLSDGLMIAQVYRIGTTPQNVKLITSGWQDNGCNKWDGSKWLRIFGADGMETAIDYTNQNTIYECYQYGGLNRSNNGGDSWEYIAPASGDWLAPFVIDPLLHKRLYFGSTSQLFRSDNSGTNWSAISGLGYNGSVIAIAVAPSNNDIVYSASLKKIFKTNIATNNSSDITAGLPVSKAGINYIAVSGSDPNKLWVALAGYSAGEKVYASGNGGKTWTNVSGTLPNLPINCAVHQNGGSTGRVFVGTDVGVFVKDSALSDWKPYGQGLPNVMVHELEINYASNMLVAGTYGRGIWQIRVSSTAPQIARNLIPLKANVYPVPTTGIVNIEIENAISDVRVDVYKLTGQKVATYNFNSAAARSIHFDMSDQPFGNYLIRIQSGDAVTTKAVLLDK